ncbi:hypothetical protein O1L60_02915 [Streptomyces diastatochromogenes]|nr:hypothetical protein [Streptomyces diastatochromogenes]
MRNDVTTPAHLYRNARVFTSDRRPWAEALVVVGDRLAHVGDEATAARVAGPDALVHDLGGATVLPASSTATRTWSAPARRRSR